MMALFKKKQPDLISDRAKALNSQIAQLEAEIKRLDERLQRGAASSEAIPQLQVEVAEKPQEPIFEHFDQRGLSSSGEPLNTPNHYNELGVRKYDLPALLRRVKNHFRGPSTTNPKLVSYLAAGGIQGLRPLRYEKRVARNRFVLLVLSLFLTLLGLIWVFVHRGL